jgi:hypothetical protein
MFVKFGFECSYIVIYFFLLYLQALFCMTCCSPCVCKVGFLTEKKTTWRVKEQLGLTCRSRGSTAERERHVLERFIYWGLINGDMGKVR